MDCHTLVGGADTPFFFPTSLSTSVQEKRVHLLQKRVRSQPKQREFLLFWGTGLDRWNQEEETWMVQLDVPCER